MGLVSALEVLVKSQGLAPPLAEASAILRGLELAKDFEFSRVVVQSDCLQVVQTIKNGVIPTTELGTILQDIKASTLIFAEFSIIFIPRSCIIVAHNLARFALSVISAVRWSGHVPPCAVRRVLKDLSLV